MRVDTIPPVAWVIAGTVVIVALARYFPRSAGWVLLAIVLAMLLTGKAQEAFKRIGG